MGGEGVRPIYTKVYFHADQVLAQTSYVYSTVEFINEVQTNTPNPVLRYKTYVFSKHAQTGIHFDGTDYQHSKVFPKDSLYKNEWAFKNPFGNTFSETQHHLISATADKQGNLVEKYKVKGITDTLATGTVELVFSKTQLQGIDFSLAKEVEETRKMKLVKAVYTSDRRYYEAAKVFQGEIVLPMTITELKIDNTDSLLSMFEYARKLELK
ncbi:MAG: hypothetical protein ABW007_15790 [Chitinophagaceae bacterium]